MKNFAKIVVAAFSAVFLALALKAQTTFVNLEGKVIDNEGKPLPGATITVRDVETGILRGASSDIKGQYKILGIPPGTYTLEARLIGHRSVTRENVQFSTGQRPVMDFVLIPEALELPAIMVIGARVEQFEARRTDVSTVVLRDQMMNLPLNSRSALNLAAVAPGIRTYAPIGGRTLPSAGSLPDLRFINFYVDGAEWKSMFNGNIVGIPQTGSPLPQEAIEEFRVIVSPFDAEYNRGGAWIINAVTRRGTNTYRVEAFSFFRDEQLNARGPFQAKRPDFNREQAGFTLSGPIVRDKLFLLGSYELHNANDFIDVIPGRPAFNPGIWDRYKGTFKAPNRNHTAVGRLTFQPSSDHTLDAIWSRRQLSSKTFFGGTAAEPAAIFGQYNITSLMLKHTFMISPNSFNEASLHYLRWRHFEPTVSTGPAHVYPSIRLGRGTFPIRVAEDHYRFINKFTTTIKDFFGPHTLKIGGELTRVRMTPWFPSFMNPEYTFLTDTSSLPRTATIGVGYLNPLDPTAKDAETDDRGWLVGFYIQDQWNPIPELTLNLGLRYDAEINTLNNKQRLPWADDTTLVRVLSPDWLNKGDRKNDLNNIAPRFSFSYDIGGRGRTILRGGYGITFDRTAYFFAYFERRDAFWRTYTFINPGTLDPAELRRRVAAGGVVATPTIHLLNKKMSTPQIHQFSLGVGHQFSDRIALNVDYINQRMNSIYTSVNVNYFKPSIRRRVLTPLFGDIVLWGSIGRAYFHGFLTNLVYRTPDVRASLSYTLSWAQSSYDGHPDQRHTDIQNFRLQRSNSDERHRLVLSAVVSLPLGFQVSGLATFASPRPYDVIDGRDLNDNNFFADDWIGGERNKLPESTFRNWYKMVDLRVSKMFDISTGYEGRAVRLELVVEAFNVFNWFNQVGFFGRKFDAVGNPLATFGKPSDAYAPRQAQLGVKVSY